MKQRDNIQAVAAVMERIQQADTIEIRADVAAFAWDFVAYHEGLSHVLPAVQMFCSAVLNQERPRRWLSLLGPSGVGKTHLLKQAFYFLSRRMRIKTKTDPVLGDSFRGPNAAHIIPAIDLSDWRAAQDYARYDLIYVEDIGAGCAGDAGSGKVVLSRITELLQLRSGRWTMMDANLYRGQIERVLDGRIASRLKRDGSWMVEIPSEVPDFWDMTEPFKPH